VRELLDESVLQWRRGPEYATTASMLSKRMPRVVETT
jgi:hypothetical protein